MPQYERHVFVCENLRDPDNPKGCCAAKGARDVRARLKRLAFEAGLRGRIRINSAGCLDQCEHGVTVVVYPEQVWYGGVTVQDVAEIVDRHIVNGEFVERLMLPSQPHLKGATRAPALREEE